MCGRTRQGARNFLARRGPDKICLKRMCGTYLRAGEVKDKDKVGNHKYSKALLLIAVFAFEKLCV